MATAKIVVPCYNEEKRLDVARFRDISNSTHSISFLFVDDGSTDNTARVLKSLSVSAPAKIAILTLKQNQGKAEAVRQGILSAIGSHPDYVGFWDADLATPLDAIYQFLDFAENRRDIEMVIGSRVKLLGRRIDRRYSRHYLGRIFATAASAVLALEVYDTQCGAKLFRSSPDITSLFQQPFCSRWIFDVEIIARLIQLRRVGTVRQPAEVIYEFPLTEWRDIPGSKVTAGDFIRAAWELLRIHNRYFRNRENSR